MLEYEPVRAKQVLDKVQKYSLLDVFLHWSEAYLPPLAVETLLQIRQVRKPAILTEGIVQFIHFQHVFPQ